MKKEAKITVLIVEPGQAPRKAIIDNTLESFQKVVGGLIEFFPLGIEGATGICNEEGILWQLPLNRYIPATQGIIFGPFIIAGDGADVKSLKPEQIAQALTLYAGVLTASQVARALQIEDQSQSEDEA